MSEVTESVTIMAVWYIRGYRINYHHDYGMSEVTESITIMTMVCLSVTESITIMTVWYIRGYRINYYHDCMAYQRLQNQLPS